MMTEFSFVGELSLYYFLSIWSLAV